MADAPVRIGFVGCGRQASAAWYPNFATIPALDLVACCDLQADLAERNARFYGARRWYTSLTRMLEAEDLDAVMVVGPPAMHYACGKEVLAAGLPLMMEKPPAPRTEQARELVELAEAQGVVTQVGHNMRHAPGVVKLRELMQTPAFGRLLFLESRYFMPGPMWHDTGDYRAGWTYMIFQSTHAVDLARFIGGEIETVFADLSVGAKGRFAIAAVAHFRSGATGTLTLTGNTPNWTCKLEAEGDARAHVRLKTSIPCISSTTRQRAAISRHPVSRVTIGIRPHAITRSVGAAIGDRWRPLLAPCRRVSRIHPRCGTPIRRCRYARRFWTVSSIMNR